MNSLNSILLEGNLVLDPVMTNDDKACDLVIETSRTYAKDDEEVTDKEQFIVRAWNKLAKGCHELLKAGREVRVVGRLKNQAGIVFIVAEHVECKPERPRGVQHGEKKD